MDLREQAFRRIQDNPVMYKIWCEALTQQERDSMLLEEAYSMGWEALAKERDSEIV